MSLGVESYSCTLLPISNCLHRVRKRFVGDYEQGKRVVRLRESSRPLWTMPQFAGELKTIVANDAMKWNRLVLQSPSATANYTTPSIHPSILATPRSSGVKLGLK